MKYGIRKGLEDIAWELKGIKNTLSSIFLDISPHTFSSIPKRL